MKIQQLTIHNIASIEDAVIDFEASPLVDSEVFLITGKTGAGKSTILDAICLALYADTPRLDGTKMEGNTKDGEGSVMINDPRQLMRKNTGEAFVSLTFTGSNGTHYKATWAVARAHKKPTGRLQAKDWVWENLDTEKRLEKDAEIKKEIKDAIGLDFDQFCRTTLLAQGEFTRFLNSADKEKATILEKITGVDVYSKIGKKIYDVTSRKEWAWKSTQQLVDEMPNPSEQEMTHKQEEAQSLEAQQSAYKRLLDKDKAKKKWLEDDDDLSKKLASAQKAFDDAVATTESETFKANESLIRQWTDTVEARGWLRAKTAAESKVTTHKGELTTLAREFAQVLAGLAFAEKERQTVETERNKLPEIKPEEEAQATQQLNNLRTQRDKTLEAKQNIKTALDRIDTYKAEKSRRKTTEEGLNKTLADIEQKKTEAAKTEPQLNDAKTKMESQKELLDKQKDTIDKFAQTMRQRLHVGDICPVCRQEIQNELPHEDELALLVNGLTEAFKEADTAYTSLMNEKNKLDAEIKTATNAYETAKRAFDNDDAVAKAGQKVIEACKACGIETIEKNTPQTLQSLETGTKAALSTLDTKIEEAQLLVTNLQATIRQRQRLDAQLIQIATRCQAVKEITDDIRLLEPSWSTLTAPNAEEMPDLLKRANDVKSKTTTALDQLRLAEDVVAQNDHLLDEYLQGQADVNRERLTALDAYSPLSISEMTTMLDGVRNKVLATKTLKEDASKNLQEHRNAKPAFNDNDTIEALTNRIADCEKMLTAMAEKKGALIQELNTDKQNRELHRQRSADAERQKADYQKWARMNQFIGDATGSKFRKIAQSYVLSSLIQSANSYMQTLTDRYLLKVDPGTFVISIEDAYQGFASRAVSTISGGESFLVSLSLALALSDIGQRLSVDTLFIDEGFGTLSGEPLQNAVNTLRTLHTKAGRHVGIISHVEELKEEIPVQIQVEQEGHNSYSTIKITPSI
ncbi:MAG: AAA family ATPase [Bacteroidales bacterium]|nr:AAA family ATPase [Bacteroidales bacterium]